MTRSTATRTTSGSSSSSRPREQAREHAEGLELHEAIKWATGNVSMPDFEVLENVMDTDA